MGGVFGFALLPLRPVPPAESLVHVLRGFGAFVLLDQISDDHARPSEAGVFEGEIGGVFGNPVRQFAKEIEERELDFQCPRAEPFAGLFGRAAEEVRPVGVDAGSRQHPPGTQKPVQRRTGKPVELLQLVEGCGFSTVHPGFRLAETPVQPADFRDVFRGGLRPPGQVGILGRCPDQVVVRVAEGLSAVILEPHDLPRAGCRPLALPAGFSHAFLDIGNAAQDDGEPADPDGSHGSLKRKNVPLLLVVAPGIDPVIDGKIAQPAESGLPPLGPAAAIAIHREVGAGRAIISSFRHAVSPLIRR